ncbi:uncharacterized protein LOC21401109 [Morus notabilis]|uniref:uncharacterized protein LOC21401109 n=1 Tax=Morus notabilis TaxID=981085 RepID=UPI000CECE7FB|nr:uncharacterized protein LOC21401109 [Morus notabilis]
MEMAIKTHFLGSNPQIITHSYHKEVFRRRVCASTLQSRHGQFSGQLYTRRSHKCFPTISAVLSGAKDVEVSSSQFEGFLVSTSSGVTGPDELKISVEVSGTITRELYDKVFDKMVADAQPIPGFRRVKGGKTPNIPKDILLEVLGPSKVIKQVIKKIINSTIAEYVDKEGLKVSKDLRVEQSFEDLESTFEAGETFNFDAILQLQEIK